jgi:hypothetical protein
MSARANFTDQKRHVATAADCGAAWGGEKNGARFRCYLCGHRFKPGDGFRWQATGGASFTTHDGKKYGVFNCTVCDDCDGPDVIERWVERNREFNELMNTRFWALQ